MGGSSAAGAAGVGGPALVGGSAVGAAYHISIKGTVIVGSSISL